MESIWNGHRVTVEAYKLARRAWITTSIDVLLDSEAILKSGGKLQFTGTCSEIFHQEDGDHRVDLSWGRSFWGLSFPFRARIDGVEVCSGRVRVARWYVQWLFVVLAVALAWLWIAHANLIMQ
jgi:hypothetical protein